MRPETAYICERCETPYGCPEDALDCEFACRAIDELNKVSSRLEDALHALNGAERLRLVLALRAIMADPKQGA